MCTAVVDKMAGSPVFDEILNLVNENAKQFLLMWEKANQIAGSPHPKEQAFDVLYSFHGKIYFYWNVNQTRFWNLLTKDDIEATRNLVLANV